MRSAKDMRFVRLGAVAPGELAAISLAALDRPLAHAAELVIGVPSEAALVLGSLQRLSELGEAAGATTLVTRRASGGAEAHVGPGSVWLQLALASPSALVACEPDRLLNRYVRPLLRALAKVGALAHYYDRDWISASKAPIASVGFAHDTTTGRALFEAFVAVDTPFAARERPSFLAKPPRTLRSLGIAADVDARSVADAVVEAYASAYGVGEHPLDTVLVGDFARSEPDDPRGDPPWAATRQEAIGIVAAGRDREGRMRVGGELMASRDAIARLENEIAEAHRDGTSDGARIDRAVDALAANGVALVGVRSLRSIRDVIAEALAQ